MPKCEKCKYCITYSTESGWEQYCRWFGYDTPEKYIAYQGDGCKCNKRTFAK